ncbi:hypothetical protein AKJ09_08464 [Labilithrix luteola]|uniref:Cytochrome c n=1 Tax=Labilithrix luteola TaxID=1391654 RepID=A0A0K1Q7K8_9BACT|nr:hypothetical protein [Labilithrix luteola]AKV01801.1 hypothetical protein AKJ09_08464 [Labilithrix luteola]
MRKTRLALPHVHALALACLVGAALLAAAPAGAANMALKDLMKKMGATAAAGDAKALSPIFAQAKTMAPSDPEFANWTAIADKGKAAADKGDLEAAKAVCKDCHTPYREKYRTKYGSKSP